MSDEWNSLIKKIDFLPRMLLEQRLIFFLDYRSEMTAKIAESVSTHDSCFVLLFLLLRVCFCFPYVY